MCWWSTKSHDYGTSRVVPRLSIHPHPHGDANRARPTLLCTPVPPRDARLFFSCLAVRKHPVDLSVSGGASQELYPTVLSLPLCLPWNRYQRPFIDPRLANLLAEAAAKAEEEAKAQQEVSNPIHSPPPLPLSHVRALSQ
eukprot:3822750-Pyramimonas_sp.AAC.1